MGHATSAEPVSADTHQPGCARHATPARPPACRVSGAAPWFGVIGPYDGAVSQVEPHELPLLADIPTQGVVTACEQLFTTYRPSAADEAAQLPAVVFIHGAFSRNRAVRPRDWAVYDGYGRLAAGYGLFAAVIDLSYLHWPFERDTLSRSRRDLDTALSHIRDLPDVSGDRIALWAFSGGALVVTEYLARQPSWLRCAALSYPLVFQPGDPPIKAYLGLRPRCPVIVTRVGQENPDWLAEVDRYLCTPEARSIEIVSVPNGHHGFDAIDDSADTREAISTVMKFVVDHSSSA
jgi:dienelactone hydrolase